MIRKKTTIKQEKPLSQMRLAFRRLKRHKLAMIGAWILFIFYFLMIFADFVSPYHFDNEKRENSYNPPTKLHFIDTNGKFHLNPFVYNSSFEFDEFYNRVYKEDLSKPYSIKFLVKGDEHKILGLFKTEYHLFGVDKPARIYLMGADSRGRDLFSRLLYGSRVSLSIGLIGVAVSLLLGTLVGGISGYFGGKIDNVLMRFCEMIMMIPGFYLMLALRTAFPPELSSVEIYFMIVLIMSFIGWAGLGRVIRGMVLSIREKEFVTAARAVGEHHLLIIIKHILPNTLSYIIVYVTLSIPAYMLGESALSLLGLGIQDPHASWGNMLSEAMSVAEIKFHPWILLPGLFIFISVIAFNFLGDGLRDAFDPKLTLGRK